MLRGTKVKATVPRVCHFCGKLFFAATVRAKYCCKNCRWIAQSKERPKRFTLKVCENCGNGFIAFVNSRRFCSQTCSNTVNSRSRRPQERVCLGCKEFFQPTSPNARYCNRKCRPERRWKNYREKHLEKYGLTVLDFEMMAAAQAGRCGICGGHPRGSCGNLVIDHCHRTGRVRALLCNNCNALLGMAEDDPERLRAAADYVERHKNG